MHISLIHPTGNPNSREAALALSEANLLYEVITTIAYDPNSSVSCYLNLLPKNISKRITDELGRRTWVSPNSVQMRTHPWREIIKIALVKTGLSERLGLRQQQLVDWVYAALDDHVAKYHLESLTAVYAYEDGAASTFQAAKQHGVICLYDLPIPFYRKNQEIQTQEANKFPDLASALQAVQEPTWKIERKEQEIQLADHIFVASSFTRKSLLDVGVQPEKISVIPYGSPIQYFQPQTKTDQVFRTLFVGRVAPGKGIHYLLKAWQELQLSEAELLLVGINEFPKNWLSQYRDIFRYVPSVPHASLNEYYSSANVLVFPSLLEGFGLVLLEAMACGIPIITTTNTAGPDIITDGVEGFIIQIRDVEALKEKLEWCYCHPQELAEMGRAARRKAEQLTWDLYRKKLGSKIKMILASC
ncbi:glycosyltransferase family 4 protein [Pelatocladus sp. BLCC-F211]|uniref:glycosyltransferase family 4 protein n=1 Tax=Pelatocladus sp. BLCC-F211 TaxID=3342752 RepID=UPI0035B7B87A